MPFFSKMMASYPFQMIRGLSPSTRVLAGGMGVGAGIGAYTNRRGGVTGMAGGGFRGAVNAAGLMGAGALGYLGYRGMGGRAGLGTFGRNMMRPGVAGMYGRAAISSGRSGLAGIMNRLRAIR